MKKLFTVALAVLVIALSVLPAFAVESPTAKPNSYVITFIDDNGVKGSATYETEIGEDGTQKVTISANVSDGYDFTGWVIEGSYTTNGTMDSNPLGLTISSDLTVYTHAKAKGDTTPTGTGTTDATDATGTTKTTTPGGGSTPGSGGKTADNGSKSPQTGSNDSVVYIVLGLSAAALVAGVIVAKRRSSEK